MSSTERQRDLLFRQSIGSDEFERIDYLLKTSLRSPSAKVTGTACAVVRPDSETNAFLADAWAISSPILTMQFEARARDLLVAESWVDTARLTSVNAASSVFQNGFTVPPQGMMFPIGTPQVSPPVSVTPGLVPKFEFLLCRVVIGRSYCTNDAASLMEGGQLVIPDGYDSLYLVRGDNSNAADISATPKSMNQAEAQTPKNYHEYVVLEGAQVIPCFLVHFTYDPSQDSAQQEVCENCDRRAATVVCLTDHARLCDVCDREVHSANKIVASHVRRSMKDVPGSFGNCIYHGKEQEYFCTVCQVPVCVQCKMIGDHSSGEKANHRLAPLADAYREVLANSERSDPSIGQRKSTLMTQLKKVDQRLHSIRDNSVKVEEDIYALLQEALYQLQEETHKKMNTLLSEELELRRQIEQLEWNEGFLKSARGVMKPADFLMFWKRHLTMKDDTALFPELPAISDVQADLRAEGKVSVTTSGEMAAAKQRALDGGDSIEAGPGPLSMREGGVPAGNVGGKPLASTTFRTSLFMKAQPGYASPSRGATPAAATANSYSNNNSTSATNMMVNASLELPAQSNQPNALSEGALSPVDAAGAPHNGLDYEPGSPTLKATSSVWSEVLSRKRTDNDVKRNLEGYRGMINGLSAEDLIVCMTLLDVLPESNPQFATELTEGLVSLFESRQDSLRVILSAVSKEIASKPPAADTFLRPSISPLLGSFCFVTGRLFVRHVLGPTFRTLIDKAPEFTMDKKAKKDEQKRHASNICSMFDNVVSSVGSSFGVVPLAYRIVGNHVSNVVAERCPEHLYSFVGTFFFIHCISNAILDPVKWGLIPEEHVEVAPVIRPACEAVAEALRAFVMGKTLGGKDLLHHEMNQHLKARAPELRGFVDALVTLPPTMPDFIPAVAIPEAVLLSSVEVLREYLVANAEKMCQVALASPIPLGHPGEISDIFKSIEQACANPSESSDDHELKRRPLPSLAV
jgi:hypothetical protein